MSKEIPEYLKEFLGSYQACFFDGWCGEPVSWGYPIVKIVADAVKWKELGEYGDLECSQGSFPSNWYLITKHLEEAEAVEKYGKITDIELGPRGGFRSITFGDKKFGSSRLYNYRKGKND